MNAAPILHLVLLLALVARPGQAGSVEDLADGSATIHVLLHRLPDPARTDAITRADVAVLEEFTRRWSEGWDEKLPNGAVKHHPSILEQRYKRKYEANPARYGRHDWDKVRVELEQFRYRRRPPEGVSITDAARIAIEAGDAPDVLYVNFRQSNAHIRGGLLYPLDKPEDGYLSSMAEEEKRFAVHEKIWPVIKRRGRTEDEHVWALPFGGLLGKVMLYRKDLLDKAGVSHPTNDWTWEDFLAACKKLTDPTEGTYGIHLGKGVNESWFWTGFLWSAGGDAMLYDAKKDKWRAAFDSRAGAVALEFYTRLCTEHWVDAAGRDRYGYAYRNVPDARQRWERGQIGFYQAYISERVFSTVDPDTTGVVAMPLGYPDENGKRHRGAELNSRMQGLYAGIKDPVVRDAAWEYIRFQCSRDAARIRTRIMVEGGLGRFMNPRYLRLSGYEDLIPLVAKGWEEASRIAIETGKPEPYGGNCQYIYNAMTKPMNRAEQLARLGKLPSDREVRVAIMQYLLKQGAIAMENAEPTP